jgi:zinc/manganese transport system permease protein
MNEFFELMIKPFIACLILTGIHAYLGLHVIERGVIFVDLALAQLAAFGTTVGFLCGWGLHSGEGYMCALSFTLVGAAVFSLTRFRRQVVPQEALIGIVYAIASAACILVLSRSAEGGEELKSLLVGHLLFVDWNEIVKIGLIYSVLGLAHWFFRKPLLAISKDPEKAFAEGRNVRLWDFFFYGVFGGIVTSSTELAGVLLVFSFLVVPAVCGVLFAKTIRARLLIGWTCGVITSMAGTAASYYLDLPTGAAIVCTFGICLVVCWVIAFYVNAGRI